MARTDIFNLENWQKTAEAAEFKAEAMARQWGVSRRQLERWTHQIFGTTPHHWLQENDCYRRPGSWRYTAR